MEEFQMRRMIVLIFSVLVLTGCARVQASKSPLPSPTLLAFPPTFTPAPSSTTTSVVPASATSTPTPTVKPTLSERQLILQQTSFARQTASPTLRPSSTPYHYPEVLALTSSPTPPSIPRLTKHEWLTEPILLEFGMQCGDGCGFPTGQFTELVLYNNGLLVRVGDGLQFTRLTERETCKVLNTIDQAGFFAYEMGVYRNPFDGAGGPYLTINSWNSRSDSWPALQEFADPEQFTDYAESFDTCEPGWCPAPPIISPPIRDVYRFLSSFDPGGWKSYIADRYYVVIHKTDNYSYGDPILEWPSALPVISELFDGRAIPAYSFILEGEYAQLWQAVDVETPGYVRSGDEWFYVNSQFLFPFQEERVDQILGTQDAEFLSGFESVTLSCKVTHGIYPIPTP
ncbi:MAG: lipoprotein [Chloroflexi bacterium]|nr:lipoprotein [Chloroflexota bacterium]